MLGLEGTVYIVDDDEVICNTIGQLVESVGLKAHTFGSAQEFLDSYCPAVPQCLILDIRMPGMSGIRLQAKLKDLGIHIPIIFVTGHGEVSLAVQAFKNGAIDFIEKPFKNQVLLDTIQEALTEAARFREKQVRQKILMDKLALLTQSERDVLDFVMAGVANKVIATELGLCQRMVEVHRASIMAKMQVDSLAELVTLVNQAGNVEQGWRTLNTLSRNDLQ